MEFILAILKDRGGINEGERNSMFWVMANALAWQTTDKQTYFKSLKKLFEDEFSHKWTWAEALNSASAVSSLIEGGYEPYKMSTEVLYKKINATLQEIIANKKLLRTRSPRNDGVMQIPKIEGLFGDELDQAVQSRQRAGGSYSSKTRAWRPAFDRSVKRKVLARLKGGETVLSLSEIFEVSQSTIRKWRIADNKRQEIHRKMEEEGKMWAEKQREEKEIKEAKRNAVLDGIRSLYKKRIQGNG